MRKLLSTLASLKLTVILIVLVGFVLSVGTILESLRGAEAAKAVYEAGWFYALQGLLALNVLAALLDRWPRNRWRIGFAVTHLSILLILLGAVLTVLFKQEGQLAIPEGQEAGVVARSPEAGAPSEIRLPFTVRLDSFEIDVYPGTQRPAMFRSRVHVRDAALPAPVPFVIEMNKPLSYGGWKFFQSSYHIEGDSRTTILSVSRDPGQAVVFAGYGLLVFGMILVFATRLVQFRQAAALRVPSELPVSSLPVRSLPVALLVLAAAGLLAPALNAATVPDAATVEKLRALPVQHDGRTMPFDTQAREAIWKVTGRTSWGGVDPVAMVAGWTFDPQAWQHEPMIAVGGADNARAAGLPPGTRFASFEQLVSSASLRDAVLALPRGGPGREDDGPREGPHEARGPPRRPERALHGPRHPLPPGRGPEGRVARGLGRDVGRRHRRLPRAPARHRRPAELPVRGRDGARDPLQPDAPDAPRVAPPPPGRGPRVPHGGRRPRAAPPARRLLPRRRLRRDDVGPRDALAGRGPHPRVQHVRVDALPRLGRRPLRRRLARAPPAAPHRERGRPRRRRDGARRPPPDRPVHPPDGAGPLRHAVARDPRADHHGELLGPRDGDGPRAPRRRRRDLRARSGATSSARWSELLYWYIHVGSILLIAGILTGSIWAASSWGRYWGWDPKEVWSLIAFLAYMAILHARFDEQIRAFGVALASIAAFWTILMTYLGVNFVLASGLHSYGFGSSSLVRIFAAIAVVEGIFLGAAWRAHRARPGSPRRMIPRAPTG